MGLLRRLASVVCTVGVCSAPLIAGTWDGDVGFGFVWQNAGGSNDSFLSQQALDSGFVVEDVDLGITTGNTQLFRLRAWGFGPAEPTEHGTMDFRLGSDWNLELTYDRGESFLGLAGSDLAGRRANPSITRWSGQATWDGWDRARLSLRVRHVDRSGSVSRPFFGLNDQYPLQVALDDTMSEATFRLVTKGLPVVVDFEQSYASFDRANRWSPGGTRALDPANPNLLQDVSTTLRDEQDVPTTRLTTSYSKPGVQTVLSLLWSSADLNSAGMDSSSFAVDGGNAGTLEFFDDLVGSASTDTLSGAYRLGVALGKDWTLRFSANYRDANSDSSLLGERLTRATDPTGSVMDLTAPIDDNGIFETTDVNGRLVLERQIGRWAVWAGGLTGNRDVRWRLSEGDETVDVSRDNNGGLAGVSVNLGAKLVGSLEYEHGSFQEYIFRTDPKTADRVTFRLRSQLAEHLTLNLNGRYESADNPTEQSDLSTDSTGVGAGLTWTPRGKGNVFGLDASLRDLSTETGLVLPGGADGNSIYDSVVTRVAAFARTGTEAVRLTGRFTWLQDDGDTWPVDAWTAALRADFKTIGKSVLGVFGEYWSYDEQGAELDDYSVVRYGVALRVSF